MECTHCKKEITGFRQSAEIPDRPDHYFIVHDCANVMIAKIVNGELLAVEPTPEDSSEKTQTMIRLCYKLMSDAGEGNYKQVSLTHDGHKMVLPEMPDLPKDDEEHESNIDVPDSDPCCRCGDASCYRSRDYDTDQDKAGFFKKLWHKFLHFVGRT